MAEAFVEEKLRSKKVVVFSKSYCPFCKTAKSVLNKYKLSPDVYEVIELENRDDCDVIQDYLAKITGARSVPRVFIAGKCIGGGSETDALEKSGKLEPMLKAAGAI